MRLSTELLPGQGAEGSRTERSLRPTDRTDGPRGRSNVGPRRDSSVSAGEEKFATQLKELLTVLAHGQSAQRTPQRIVITGVHTETEASFLTLSLAMTCASSGYRVLLIDANYVRPTVHRNLGLSTERGLSTLLSSSDPPHALPQATAFPNLAAITIGPECSNWSSLLTREHLFHRLAPLAPSFDYMIVDCGSLPPSLVGRISALADNVLVAVKQHVSSMHELANIVDTLRGEGVQEPAILMIE